MDLFYFILLWAQGEYEWEGNSMEMGGEGKESEGKGKRAIHPQFSLMPPPVALSLSVSLPGIDGRVGHNAATM